MPAETSYPIGVKLTGGSAKEGYVLIKNGRTGDYNNIRTNSTYEVVTNLTKLTNDGLTKNPNNTHTTYAVGDIIQIEASGNRTGSTTHTVVKKGGVTIKLTCVDVTTTNAPVISIG